MFYELWDIESGNIVNTYDTKEEALTVVRGLLALNGPEYADALSLSFEDNDEESTLVAEGPDLAQRAASAEQVRHSRVDETDTSDLGRRRAG